MPARRRRQRGRSGFHAIDAVGHLLHGRVNELAHFLF